jgi:predicted acetyltransferase
MGWEIAGTAGRAEVPTRSLAAIRTGETLPVVALGDADDAEVRTAYAAAAPAVPGALDRSDAWWRFLERVRTEERAFRYGVRRDGRLTGYVQYRQVRGDPWGFRFEVDDVVAADPDTAGTLWRFLGGSSMQAEHARVPLPLLSRLLPLLDEQDTRTVVENRWMHRIVDLPGFAAVRATAADAAAPIVVAVHDPWPGGVGGTWRLGAAAGRLTAEAADDVTGARAAVTLDVGGLSALAVGGTSVGALDAAGRVHGDADAVRALGRLLAAPPPCISDDF